MNNMKLKIRDIQPKDYATGMDLIKAAVKDYVGEFKIDPIEFNFKAKNFFVMPGNISRGIFIDDLLVGFVVCTHYETLWNNEKKLYIELFYIESEHRTQDNINKIYTYIEDYAYTNGYSSIRFDDSLPYFSDYVKDSIDAKQISTMYEKELI
jgi:hypothetical protein